jgi:hypothetical protein
MTKRWYHRFFIRNWSISWKLTLTILGVFVLGLGLIAAVGNVLVRNSLLEGQKQELVERAIQERNVIRGFRDNLLTSLYWVALQNQDVIFNADAYTCRMALYHDQVASGVFSNLMLLDGSGQVLAATRPLLEGQNFGSTDWFSRAVRDQQPGMSHLMEIENESGKFFIFYLPVPAEEGFWPATSRSPRSGSWSTPSTCAPAGTPMSSTRTWSPSPTARGRTARSRTISSLS